MLKAAESGDLTTVRVMIDRLPEGNASVDFLQNVLMRTNDIHIVALLIQSGATDTMLLAAERGDLPAVRGFLESGTPVDLQDSSTGKTALMLTKDLGVAEMLLDDGGALYRGLVAGAEVDLEDKSGKTALRMTRDNLMAALLTSRGAEDTVLLAAERGDLEAVRRHLDLGMSKSVYGRDTETGRRRQEWSAVEKNWGRKTRWRCSN